MKVVISSGHGKYVSGASGILDEVTEARRVVTAVAGYLRQCGVTVTEFHDDTSKNQSQNLSNIVSFHNKQSRDLDISVHFNAYVSTGMAKGTEALYYSEAELAAETSKAIADASGFKNRGAKKNTGLYFLSETKKPAILIEVCFVDSVADADIYRANFDGICRAIAVAISGKSINETSSPDENAVKRFNALEEIPEYAKPAVKKLIERGFLAGNGDGLNLTEDMIRLLVINDRAGLYR